MTIAELAKRSSNFVINLDAHIETAVNNSQDIILETNKRQLSESKLSTGKTITPPYSKGYAAFKGFKNPNLLLTGDFQDAMFLSVKPKEYLIGSTDWKSLLLIDKYSDFIFGIFYKEIVMAKTTSEIEKLYIKNVL